MLSEYRIADIEVGGGSPSCGQQDPLFCSNTKLESELLAQAGDYLPSIGFERYTTYHWARNGHTSAYVLNRLNGMDFVGFGLGARSFLDGISWANTTDWHTRNS